MTNESAKRPPGKCPGPANDDHYLDDDDLDDMSFRPSHWKRGRRSRKNPTDLEIWKTELRRKIKAGSKRKKVKLSNRDMLDFLFFKKPIDGTPEEKMLALVELLEELHPSPNPTFETILDMNMEPFPDFDDI